MSEPTQVSGKARVEEAPPRSYREQVLSSLAWHGAAQLGAQAASWAATVVVIRLLTPADYGLMAMAQPLVAFLLMVSDLGIGAALVQVKELSQRDIRQVQGFVLTLNAVAAAATWLASDLIAAFFGEPRVAEVLEVLSVSFLFIAAYAIPQALLMRDLEFDRKARVDFVAMSTAPLISLGCAFAGFGVWSLVAGAMSSHFLRAVGYNWLKPGHLRPHFSFRDSAKLLTFGSLVSLSRVLWWASVSVDVVIAGRVLGKEALGLYAVVLSLSAIPIEKLTPILNQVSFSAFSRIQSEDKRVIANLARVLEYAALLFLPVLWGMALIAEDGLPLALGGRWGDASVPFILIAVVLPLKALSTLLWPVLFATDRIGVHLGNTLAHLVIMSTCFWLGVNSGLEGLAWAWVVGLPLSFVITVTRSLRAVGMPLATFAASLRTAVIAALCMVGAVLAVQEFLPPDWNPVARILVDVATGGLSYGLIVLALDRSFVSKFRELIGR